MRQPPAFNTKSTNVTQFVGTAGVHLICKFASSDEIASEYVMPMPPHVAGITTEPQTRDYYRLGVTDLASFDQKMLKLQFVERLCAFTNMI